MQGKVGLLAGTVVAAAIITSHAARTEPETIAALGELSIYGGGPIRNTSRGPKNSSSVSLASKSRSQNGP
jgi:hypothetical protein